MRPRRGHKHGAYDSTFEAECGNQLLKFAKLTKNTTIRIPYHIERKYVPDWIDEDLKLIIEAKGYFPQADRAKMLAVKADNPNYTIILLLENPHCKLNKNSKTEYWQWAEKHGFIWGYMGDVVAEVVERRKMLLHEKETNSNTKPNR